MTEAFIIGAGFIGEDHVALVLGDNVCYGAGFVFILQQAARVQEGAVIFGYSVQDPTSFGVVEMDKDGRGSLIEEKPANPKSNLAVPGLYFCDNGVVESAKNLEPSERGELEITGVNNVFLKRSKLKVLRFNRGMAWLDTSAYDGLLEATKFVSIIQKRQGLYISCIEEIAYRNGWINREQLLNLADPLSTTDFGICLKGIVRESKGRFF